MDAGKIKQSARSTAHGAPRQAGAARAPRTEPLLRRLIGASLRARRERQERTLRDVAAAARVSVAYLSEIERGRKEPSSEVLIAVCHALDMRLVDLVADAHAQLLRFTALDPGPAPVAPVSRPTGGRSGAYLLAA